MLGGDLNALGGFKDKLFEYGAVFTEADNKEATMFCYVLFRLAEHQVALAAKDLTGKRSPIVFHTMLLDVQFCLTVATTMTDP